MRDEQDLQSLLPSQVLSNLVMEELLPELRTAIGPRLKGKAQERQRTWIQVRGWGCWGVGRGRLPSPCLHCLCFAGMGDEGGGMLGPPFPTGLGAWASCLPRHPLSWPPAEEPVLSAVASKAPRCAPASSPAQPCLRCRVPGAREANRRKPSPGYI